MGALSLGARIAVFMAVAFIAPEGDAFGAMPADQQPFEPLEWVGQVKGRAPGGDHAAFDRAGSAFITKSADAVHVWDARTLEPITKPLEHFGARIWLLSGDGKTVFTAGTTLRLWDVA